MSDHPKIHPDVDQILDCISYVVHEDKLLSDLVESFVVTPSKTPIPTTLHSLVPSALYLNLY